MALILGLTGSIGSGKSYVTSCLESLGAVAIRADELAREVVAAGTSGLEEIKREFGSGVLTEGGELDRRKMAAVVFSDEERRRVLESIIHPRVRDRELELIAANGDAPLIVIEIPLLFETGAEDICDKVVVVTISEQERLRRLERDRGMTREEVDRRLAAQMPQEEKVKRADYVLDNSGNREQTRTKAEELFRQLTTAH